MNTTQEPGHSYTIEDPQERECCGGKQCKPELSASSSLASDIIAMSFGFGIAVVILATFLQLAFWVLDVSPWN